MSELLKPLLKPFKPSTFYHRRHDHETCSKSERDPGGAVALDRRRLDRDCLWRIVTTDDVHAARRVVRSLELGLVGAWSKPN